MIGLESASTRSVLSDRAFFSSPTTTVVGTAARIEKRRTVFLMMSRKEISTDDGT